VREWDEHGRATQAAKNLALQDVDLGVLDDADLMAHATRTVEHAVESWQLHFILHGADLGPIGMLISESAAWSLPVGEVISALAGASPSTSEPTRLLAALRQRVEASGVHPTTLEGLRAASPKIAADLDAYLRLRGTHVFSRYDIDGVTLGEVPDVVLASVLGAQDVARADDPEGLAASLRARVPAAERARFDELLAEARLAMDLRDDNGPHTVEWTLGLIRLALLEIGRRLVERGRVDDARLVMELKTDELSTVLTERGPTNEELSRRAEHRRWLSALTAPATLGAPEPEPPPGTLPRALETLVAVVQCVINLLDKQPARHGLAGTGVGTRSYTGRVRIARSPEEAVNNVEVGDVLVVPFTTPAYNVILSAVGAIVTVDGGPLSHAAVLARELEIPAVVGASEALAQLRDGMLVEVDPAAGEVRVLSAVPTPVGQ
jgi:pyruvate,water dikinase